MRVDVEYVKKLQDERMKINNQSFENIEWYEGGKRLNIDKSIIDDFKFTGLNNTDFIISEFYKEGYITPK